VGPVIYPPNQPVVLPPRLTDGSQEALIERFDAEGGKLAELPLRPGYGTLGTEINLRANFFTVKLPKGPFYDYSVTITDVTPKTVDDGGKDIKGSKGKGKARSSGDPATIKSWVKRRIFELLDEDEVFEPYRSLVVHDYSQRIIAAKELPQPLQLTIAFREDSEEEKEPEKKKPLYEVTIQFLGEINLGPINQFTEGDLQGRTNDLLPTLSALNLILQYPASHNGVRLGKKDSNGATKYFFDPSEIHSDIRLSTGVQVWRGFFISVRPTFKQLMVNVNVCSSAFIEPRNLAEVLLEVKTKHGTMPRLPSSVVGSIRVKTRHLGHKKKLFAIGTNTARNQQITVDGERISVEEFFKRRHNQTLEHAHDLPVVCLGYRDAKRKKDPEWVPAELCDIIPGCARIGKLTSDETAEMIQIACKPPGINARCILEDGLLALGFSPQAKAPILASFGIDIGDKMSDIPGHVLAAPKLSYHNGPVTVKKGAWNIVNARFHQGAKVESFWVVYVDDPWVTNRRPPELNRISGLVSAFQQKCLASGMDIQGSTQTMLTADLNTIQHDDDARTGALRLIQNLIQEQQETAGKPGFILVLLRGIDKCIYPGIKRICDVILGIHTFHMQLDTALQDRRQDQYLSNVALKVNTKLGGINHKLDDSALAWLKTKSTMMVGIDVTHAGPGSRSGTPSIAAVVASVNDSFVQFPASLRIQKHAKNKETLDELREMLIERLEAYASHNKNQLPERVFVFRDGVSEGQFLILLKEELTQILEAFEGVRTGYRPLLSFVVCGKRHHAKPFATDERDADKNGNTTPGTVVDRGITAVFDFDFYLQAHAGIQGTVKMTHYTIIYDETHFSADEIQKGTYDFSYLYGRATRSVSLIPPAYYADIACERGRCYLNALLNVDDKATTSVLSDKSDEEGERQRVLEEAKKHWGNGVHDDLRGSMFYI